MDRRRFLKVSSLAVVSVAAGLPFPWSTAAATAKGILYGDAWYRAGDRGRILVSTDAGSTWNLHSNLGDDYVVSALAVDRANRLQLTARFGQRSFGLTLAPDRLRWLTT